jgi:hypothetical protein
LREGFGAGEGVKFFGSKIQGIGRRSPTQTELYVARFCAQ